MQREKLHAGHPKKYLLTSPCFCFVIPEPITNKGVKVTSPRIIAAKNGERKYTGKPCKVCGCTERYTANASCVECTKKSAFKNADLIRQHIQEAREGA